MESTRPAERRRRSPDRSGVAAELAGAGYRPTPQRLMVWEALESCHPHAAILDVFDLVTAKLPTISLRTVYDIVHLYERLGLVRLVQLPGGARVEKEFTSHVHGYCEACGGIINIAWNGLPSGTVTTEGFVVRSTEAVVTGWCASCARQR